MIRDVAPKRLPVTETVDLSTDEDLAAFVTRLLDLTPETPEDLRAGRKRFRLAAPEPGHRTAPAPRRRERNGQTAMADTAIGLIETKGYAAASGARPAFHDQR
jgi:hypothetical protein